jgi:predicted Fe-Mo cluster-binding NifX family protein
MRIAIATDNSLVSEHFGRCPSYTLVDIENNQIKNKVVLDNPGHEPGKIPQFLNAQGVNVIIAGGMGPRAVGFFQDFNIEVIMGLTGPIESVINSYISGNLQPGESTCTDGGGKGYGIDKTVCDH